MPGNRIQDLPHDDRPREKLAGHGAAALSDAELVAILLRTGIPGRNAVEIARDLLAHCTSLTDLARLGPAGIRQAVPGIGPVKALELTAALELGTRLARERITRQRLDTPQAVNELLGGEMRSLPRESLRVLLLDTRYHLQRVVEVSTGSVNESIAHPRDIFQPAVAHSAYAIIVVHNHPSGDPSPSEADRRLTRRLTEASALLQIPLLDHVILGMPADHRPAYFSFKEAGLL